jgi:hypothetical protein
MSYLKLIINSVKTMEVTMQTNHKAKLKLLIGSALTFFVLSGPLFVQAEPFSSAYGAQAQMSPATTSSLSLSSPPSQSSGPYNPGNGVYLTGQPAVSSGLNMPGAFGAGMPGSSAPGMPAMGYGGQSPYMAYPSMMGMQSPMNSMGYQNAPMGGMMGGGAQQFGGGPFANANTYEAYKPMYGQPAHMVQRNSASYASGDLPYRNRPSMVLNPNSNTGPQSTSAPSNAISGVLNAPRISKGGANWLGKVFRKDPAAANMANAAVPNAMPSPMASTASFGKPSRW